MRVAIFSSKPYDCEFLDAANRAPVDGGVRLVALRFDSDSDVDLAAAVRLGCTARSSRPRST